MQENRFYTLDVLRGVAALTVAAGHFIVDGAVKVDGRYPEASEFGIMTNFSFIYAVDFFLVLSGFILAHSYFSRMDISFRDYAARRFFRMYPLHLITLLATICIFLVFGLELKEKPVLLHFMFLQNMGAGPSNLTLNVPAWTISIEFWINIGVFLALLVFRPKSVGALIGTFLIAVSCFVAIYLGSGHMDVHSEDYLSVLNAGLIRCFGSFLLGIITYELFSRLKWRSTGWLLPLMAVLAFFSIILSLPGGSILGFGTPFLFAAIVLVLALGEASSANLVKRLAFFGNISFAVYLVHFPVVIVLREIGFQKSVPMFALYLAAVIALATLAHFGFERPVYRRSLKVFSGRRPQGELAVIPVEPRQREGAPLNPQTDRSQE